jgi:long-chain acyl-CoA synthetase
MKGYYKNAKATKESIDEYGWFDTGDLGRINPCTGDLILTGRVKDTIVLSNGENIEPIPIEDAILGGTKGLVEQVMLTTDERKLIAITVLNPVELYNLDFLTKDESKQLLKANELMNDPKCTTEDCDVSSQLLQKVSEKLRNDTSLQKTLVDLVKSSTKEGFRSYENVNTVYITLEPFAMSNGQLTQSYKVKRDSVFERYSNELPK